MFFVLPQSFIYKCRPRPRPPRRPCPNQEDHFGRQPSPRANDVFAFADPQALLARPLTGFLEPLPVRAGMSAGQKVRRAVSATTFASRPTKHAGPSPLRYDYRHAPRTALRRRQPRSRQAGRQAGERRAAPAAPQEALAAAFARTLTWRCQLRPEKLFPSTGINSPSRPALWPGPASQAGGTVVPAPWGHPRAPPTSRRSTRVAGAPAERGGPRHLEAGCGGSARAAAGTRGRNVRGVRGAGKRTVEGKMGTANGWAH